VISTAESQIFDAGPLIFITKHEPFCVNATSSSHGAVTPERTAQEEEEEEDARLEVTPEELADALNIFNGQMNLAFLQYLQTRVGDRQREEQLIREREERLQEIKIPKEGNLFVK
jgi:hypothetical protein